MSKRKPYNDRAGYVASRKSSPNGGWVVIYVATEQGIDVDGNRYAIVCESHGTMVGANKIQDARVITENPANFCEECQKLEDFVELEEASRKSEAIDQFNLEGARC